MSKPYRVLAIDGGGVRGLLPAIWLHKLEKELGAPLHQHFDLIVGTSTGSILAGAIACGLSLEECVGMYRNRAEEVFPGNKNATWEAVKRLVSKKLSGPLYDGVGLEHVLRDAFGDLLMSDCKCPLMIPTYNLLNGHALMLKSWRHDHGPLPLWSAAKASSSAPTFFPAHVVHIGHADLPLVDGGVVAGSPALVGLTEAVRLNREQETGRGLEDIVMVSVGTGQAAGHISIEEGLTWGSIDWGVPLFDVVFDGSRQVVNYSCRYLLKEKNYFRMQVRLDAASEDMDNADAANINALASVAQNYLVHTEGKRTIQRIVDKLGPEANKEDKPSEPGGIVTQLLRSNKGN